MAELSTHYPYKVKTWALNEVIMYFVCHMSVSFLHLVYKFSSVDKNRLL